MKNAGSRSAALNNLLLDFSESLMPLISATCLWKLSGLDQMTSKAPSRSNILTLWKGLKIDTQVYSWADRVHTITSRASLHFYNRAFANDQRNFEVLFFFCFGHTASSVWGSYSPVRDGTHILCSGSTVSITGLPGKSQSYACVCLKVGKMSNTTTCIISQIRMFN